MFQSTDISASVFGGQSQKGKIESIPIKKWGLVEVSSFIQFLQFSEKEKEFLDNFVEGESVTGKLLLSSDYGKYAVYLRKLEPYIKQWKEAGFSIDYKFLRKSFWKCLQQLRSTPKFNIGWYRIFFKLVSRCPPQIRSNSLGFCEQMSDVMTDSTKFYRYYFEPFVKMLGFDNEYREYEKKNGNQKFSLNYKEYIKKLRGRVAEYIRSFEDLSGRDFFDDYYFFIMNLPDAIVPLNYHDDEEKMAKLKEIHGLEKTIFNHFKVKLVITEIYRDDQLSEKKYRKLFSPILSIIPKIKQRFGVFHSAVIIGPWYLDWNNGNIVVPKQFRSAKVFYVLDVDFLSVELKEDAESIGKVLSSICHEWNNDYMYNRVTRNCQHFVDEVLKGLKIDFKEKTQSKIFKDFFGKLRTKGEGEAVFTPSKEFIDEFGIKFKSKKFDKHVELDDFVCSLPVGERVLKKKFPAEFNFLKAIDRAFWLKCSKFPHSANFLPKVPEGSRVFTFEEGNCICPFKNPISTGSFFGKR